MRKTENQNPFKELENSTEIPPELRTKVMASVDFSRLLINLSDLFTVKIAETVRELFKIEIPKEKNTVESDEDQNQKS